MSFTVSFDNVMTQDVEEIAARNGLTATEYVMRVVTEAIEDAYDYERCSKLIDEYEKDPESTPHDEVMRRYGLL